MRLFAVALLSATALFAHAGEPAATTAYGETFADGPAVPVEYRIVADGVRVAGAP